MVNAKYSFLHLLFLVLFCAGVVVQDAGGSRVQKMLPNYTTSYHVSLQRRELRLKDNARRLMIGSVAPTCTYNECRGCKYRCRAEQVPVEGNDPMNSAYHYKCVCHR